MLDVILCVSVVDGDSVGELELCNTAGTVELRIFAVAVAESVTVAVLDVGSIPHERSVVGVGGRMVEDPDEHIVSGVQTRYDVVVVGTLMYADKLHAGECAVFHATAASSLEWSSLLQ